MILNIKISEEVMLGKEKVKDPKLMNILRKGFVWVIKKIYLCNSQKSQFPLQREIKDSICMHFLICTLVFVTVFKKHIKNISIAKKV